MDNKDSSGKWDIVREQLITLWAFNKQSPEAQTFQNFLEEEFVTPCLNLKICTHVCHFLLGLIWKEERDKLIKWPIVNIQAQAQFRKAILKMIPELMLRYPFINLKKLQGSYLMDPSQNQKRILDFIQRLSNLAFHLAIDDPLLLVNCCRDDLNLHEIEMVKNVVQVARFHAERFITENQFPLTRFEQVRVNITNKCVQLKQESIDLQSSLNCIKRNLMEKGVLNGAVENEVEYVKAVYNKKINEMEQTNKELQSYSNSGMNVLEKLKQADEYVSLTADDLSIKSGHSSFSSATSKAISNLQKLFDELKLNEVHIKQKEEYYKHVKNIKETLKKEQSMLQSFISKYSDQ